MNKLTVIKLDCKLRFKYKKKRHKIFNIEINNDIVLFFLNFKKKEKASNEIAALFKKKRLLIKYLNLNELQT